MSEKETTVLGVSENHQLYNKVFKKIVQWNLPIADISNSGDAMNSGQNVKSQMWQSF